MTTLDHVLVVPVNEGGELVFAHALDSGIRVWMRGLVRRSAESARRPRGVAAPLYGGSIRDMAALRDFVTNFVDHATDDPAVPLSPGRIRDTRPLVRRTDHDSPNSRKHFTHHAMSPMHTNGAWDGAAPELLISRVRGEEGTGAGYFATGLPELPADATPTTTLPAAVISWERAKDLSEYLHAPVGDILR
ncbi:hypothetical protein [Streptomyces sp. NPDC001933]|uniref:hypothetical protein n=1 Tax=Streptomyces sp. NPDC001933 TaxID=3364626 RepID=UPI0036CD0F4C